MCIRDRVRRSRRDRLEAEKLSILTSVPGIDLDRLPTLRDHEDPKTQRKRTPLEFNQKTLERFRDFIDSSVLASPSRTAIGAFFLVKMCIRDRTQPAKLQKRKNPASPYGRRGKRSLFTSYCGAGGGSYEAACGASSWTYACGAS